ncbi:MAG: glycine zipper 2TM domain-containing protein [Gammaproteobacteria bacterium]|nr:glycine zipper 2TM domain-containing protein [Gammaproteobacteria bacterium]
MKRIAVSALALAISAVAVGAAGAQDYGRGYDSRYDNDSRTQRTDVATVISAVPIYDRYAAQGYQRQECWDERSNAYDDGYYRDSNGRLYRNGTDSNANGTLIGALIGGALGNQAGKGDGRKAATIGGAVIGGVIGNQVDRNNDASGNYDQYRDNAGTVRRCRTVTDYDNNSRQVEGYTVTYRYAGQTYTSYTTRRPGRTMRVVVDVRPVDDGSNYRR